MTYWLCLLWCRLVCPVVYVLFGEVLWLPPDYVGLVQFGDDLLIMFGMVQLDDNILIMFGMVQLSDD